jgi:hypothetical protein
MAELKLPDLYTNVDGCSEVCRFPISGNKNNRLRPPVKRQVVPQCRTVLTMRRLHRSRYPLRGLIVTAKRRSFVPLLSEDRLKSHRIDVVSIVSVRVRLVLRPIVSCAVSRTTFEILQGRIGSAIDCSLERHWTASDVQEWRSIHIQWLYTSSNPTNLVINDVERCNVDMLDFPYTVFLDKLVPEDVELPGSNAQVCVTKHGNLDTTSDGFPHIPGNLHNDIEDWTIVVDALRQTFRTYAFQPQPCP